MRTKSGAAPVGPARAPRSRGPRGHARTRPSRVPREDWRTGRRCRLSRRCGAAAARRPTTRRRSSTVTVSEVEFRRNARRPHADGPRLSARTAPGPFPAVLDLHGGAWNAKDRHAEEPMDRALAASGVLVVAIDMTLAPEAPYPACVQDANYGVRWLKWKAPSWNGDASKIGIYGSSSGGHVAELLACARAIRATTRFRCRRRRTSTPRWRTWRCARRSATRTRASRTPRR